MTDPLCCPSAPSPVPVQLGAEGRAVVLLHLSPMPGLGGVVVLAHVLGTKADIWDLGELGLSHSKWLTSEMGERPQDPKSNCFGTASDNTAL